MPNPNKKRARKRNTQKTHLLEFVILQSTARGKPVALLAPQNESAQKFGDEYEMGISGQYSDEKAAANILFNMNKKLKGRSLYLSYEPSQLEIGMAWRAEIASIIYLKDNKICTFIPSSEKFQCTQKNPQSTLVERLGYHENNNDINTLHGRLKEISRCRRIPEFEENIHKGKKTDKSHFELVKLYDKNIQELENTAIIPTNDKVTEQEKMAVIDEAWMHAVYRLVEKGWCSNEEAKSEFASRREAGHNIAGIIVGPNGKPLAAGYNMKSFNKSYHAETMMIMALLRETKLEQIPRGSTVYTSLECCPMCAGHIITLGQDIRVVFGLKDPYFKAENGLQADNKNNNGCIQSPTASAIRTSLEQGLTGQDIIQHLQLDATREKMQFAKATNPFVCCRLNSVVEFFGGMRTDTFFLDVKDFNEEPSSFVKASQQHFQGNNTSNGPVTVEDGKEEQGFSSRVSGNPDFDDSDEEKFSDDDASKEVLKSEVWPEIRISSNLVSTFAATSAASTPRNEDFTNDLDPDDPNQGSSSASTFV